MKNALSPLLALLLLGTLPLSASQQIGDPVSFVAGVYRHLIKAQSTQAEYEPREDIYTPQLAKLVRDDRKRANGEVGCIDFDFWVNGQDWKITHLTVAKGAASLDRETVIARFVSIGASQELHFDFQRVDGRWLLDDVHSTKKPRWTLSELLKCAL